MHPTVTEQLREIRRVLAEVVMPEVGGDYAREALQAALATLGMLEGAWDRVLPFLRWDNERVAQLLSELDGVAAHAGPTGLLDDRMAGRIAAAISADPPDPTDFAALHRRNLELRALLAEAVPALVACTGGVPPEPVVAYVRERIDRYPFTGTAALPGRR